MCRRGDACRRSACSLAVDRIARGMHVHFVGEHDDSISVSSHHARALCEVGYDVSFAPPHGPDHGDLQTVDAVHVVTREQLSTRLFRRLAAARVAGIPMVRFWTGRDVLWAQHHAPTRSIGVALQKLGVVQRCRTDQGVEDLASLGVDAAIGPIVNPNLSDRAQPEPLPTHFTALCYLPSRRRAFCGGELIDRMIRALPDVRFLILGDSGTDYGASKNVESLGLIEDIARAILRSTVVLQPRLDGVLSRLSLEALSHGRHVIGRRAWACCHCAETPADFVQKMRELKHSPSFNLDGREHVCAKYEKRAAVGELCALLREITNRRFSRRRILGGWLGVAAILRSSHLLTDREFSPPAVEDLGESDHAFAALLDCSTATAGAK